jgi:hypothetical protein
MAVVKGKVSDVYITSGAPIAMTNEPMTGDGTRKIYTVTNPVKRYWDPNTALVFRQSLDSGGTWNPVVPDTVQNVGGIVTFVVARQLSPLAQIQVTSGSYLPFAKVAGGKEWDLNPQVALLDATVFGMNSKFHVATQVGDGTASVKRFYQDDTMRALLGGRLVLVLYVDATAQPAGPRYEMFARLKQDALKTNVASLEEEDLSFDIDGDCFFLAS